MFDDICFTVQPPGFAAVEGVDRFRKVRKADHDGQNLAAVCGLVIRRDPPGAVIVDHIPAQRSFVCPERLVSDQAVLPRHDQPDAEVVEKTDLGAVRVVGQLEVVMVPGLRILVAGSIPDLPADLGDRGVEGQPHGDGITGDLRRQMANRLAGRIDQARRPPVDRRRRHRSVEIRYGRGQMAAHAKDILDQELLGHVGGEVENILAKIRRSRIRHSGQPGRIDHADRPRRVVRVRVVRQGDVCPAAGHAAWNSGDRDIGEAAGRRLAVHVVRLDRQDRAIVVLVDDDQRERRVGAHDQVVAADLHTGHRTRRAGKKGHSGQFVRRQADARPDQQPGQAVVADGKIKHPGGRQLNRALLADDRIQKARQRTGRSQVFAGSKGLVLETVRRPVVGVQVQAVVRRGRVHDRFGQDLDRQGDRDGYSRVAGQVGIFEGVAGQSAIGEHDGGRFAVDTRDRFRAHEPGLNLAAGRRHAGWRFRRRKFMVEPADGSRRHGAVDLADRDFANLGRTAGRLDLDRDLTVLVHDDRHGRPVGGYGLRYRTGDRVRQAQFGSGYGRGDFGGDRTGCGRRWGQDDIEAIRTERADRDGLLAAGSEQVNVFNRLGAVRKDRQVLPLAAEGLRTAVSI